MREEIRELDEIYSLAHKFLNYIGGFTSKPPVGLLTQFHFFNT